MNDGLEILHTFESARGGYKYRVVRCSRGRAYLQHRRYANREWHRLDQVSADVVAREMAKLIREEAERRGVTG